MGGQCLERCSCGCLTRLDSPLDAGLAGLLHDDVHLPFEQISSFFHFDTKYMEALNRPRPGTNIEKT